jgi:hypothetical protein
VAATKLVGGHGNVVQVEPMGEDEALALLHTRVSFGESSQADATVPVHLMRGVGLCAPEHQSVSQHQTLTRNDSTIMALIDDAIEDLESRDLGEQYTLTEVAKNVA